MENNPLEFIASFFTSLINAVFTNVEMFALALFSVTLGLALRNVWAGLSSFFFVWTVLRNVSGYVQRIRNAIIARPVISDEPRVSDTN